MTPPSITTTAPPPASSSSSSSSSSSQSSPYLNVRKPVVVLVDPYSTGCIVGQEIQRRYGCLLVALWTEGFAPEMKLHVPKACGTMNYYAQIGQQPTMELTKQSLLEAVTQKNNSSDAQQQQQQQQQQQHDIIACIAGGEAGVDYADAFSEYLHGDRLVDPHSRILTNGTKIPNRRDKYVQQELCKQSGLRSVRQVGSPNFTEDVQAFLRTEPYPVVLKPTESAGSDGVKLCYNYDEARQHFEHLMKSQLVNGGSCPSVLCQEFLKGQEFVVDSVSRNGVHKTTMIWVYDKRPQNGSAFVYYGMKPVDPTTAESKILINYTRRVLDALGIQHGPTHAEIMMTNEGPCLVEMNCRAHGGDGCWRPLAKALTGGYSQVEVSADAYCCLLNNHDDDKAFKSIPDIPPFPFKATGQEVMFVNNSRGTVKATPGYDVIKMMPSFVHMDGLISIGQDVDYTVDLITGIGSVVVMHKDAKVVERDIEFIRYLEDINGFFVYETRLENLKRPTSDAFYMTSTQSLEDNFKPLTLGDKAHSLLGPSPPGPGGKPPRHHHQQQQHLHRRVFSSDGPSLIRHMSNDRPELRGPLMKRMTTVDSSKEVVVLVDPYSTGCCIAEEMMKRGFSVIALWTRGFSPEMKTHVPLSVGGGQITYLAEVEEGETLNATSEVVYKAAGQKRVVACLAGGEAGVDLADALSEHIKVRTNGTAVANRRDKKVQQEIIRKHGLRSVRQAGGSKFEDVEEFLRKEQYPVVLKPVESAGSDGVKLCHDFAEAHEHFEQLMKSQMVNGGDCPAVLCQEFLQGKEYVIDHVSRDGEHKTVMVWVYDKRRCNNAAFVYFGCVPVDSESPEAKILIPYVRGVLDALEFKNGPSHAEVMMTSDGPCLVEMNCRAHGGDGNWRPLCLALTGGYSQVEATVDAYLDKKQFSLLPDKPPSPFKAAGQEVILVSYGRGEVLDTPGFEDIKEMESYVCLETGVRPGSIVDYTVDLFTGIGSVILMHHDPAVLEADVERIRQMEKNNHLFTFVLHSGNFLNSHSVMQISQQE
eukprot:CAMPEP_0113487704 /NCGR_PEP_ID=MMETSP0014_2-20120614/25642_1 /TAXON_ID=2857 /ORGANISM="Nitzschia sp." /LENGTH=1036 /DNA_ID=CAMNT_0000381401 /DNA_START=102 /DNA_END=3212 /DNA_ORIENTATION=- /assembly_acc=CAM_ASM_000159